MIEIINGWALGGLAAAALPVIVHIAHRRKYIHVDWGAMRFLVDLVSRRRRRLLIDQLLLLAVRVAALTALALALCRPALDLGDAAADRIVRRGAVASVLLIDDSLSANSGRGEPAFSEAKRLALAYLETLRAGDEVSVLTLSRLRAQAAEPVYDLEAAKAAVAALAPRAVASDAPALLEAGLAQLGRHLNPSCELVIVADGRRDGWGGVDPLRWGELRRRLGGEAADVQAQPGSRSRPQVVLLAPTPRDDGGNLAVVDVRMDRALIPSGRPVGVRVACAHVGATAPEGALLRLSVDGRAVAERPLAVQAGGTAEVTFSHVFPAPGSYIVEAAVEGARDPLPQDDRRAWSVQVEQGVPVLLVEGGRGEGVAGGLGLVAIALDPAGAKDDLFAVARINVGELGLHPLDRYRVVVLGDVPALDSAAIRALESFVVAGGGLLVAGGGLLVAPGPSTDLALANRFWARGGHGFLPCAIAGPADADPAPIPGMMMIGHPAFSAFTARAAEAWKAGRVRRWLRLDPVQARDREVQRLLELDNGDPLIVERGRGLGRVALVCAPLDLQWTELPHQASFVPLVRGLVSYLGSTILPPRNLRPGERLTYRPEGTGDTVATVEGPPGVAPALAPGSWEGHAALVSEPLLVPGAYAVRESGAQRVTRFACAVPTSESALDALADEDLAPLAGVALRRCRDGAEIARSFGEADRRSIELWRWLLAGAVALLFLETWLCRRLARAEQSAAQPPPEPAAVAPARTAGPRPVGAAS